MPLEGINQYNADVPAGMGGMPDWFAYISRYYEQKAAERAAERGENAPAFNAGGGGGGAGLGGGGGTTVGANPLGPGYAINPLPTTVAAAPGAIPTAAGGAGWLANLQSMWGSLPPYLQDLLIGSGLNLIAGDDGGGQGGAGGFYGGPYAPPQAVDLPPYQMPQWNAVSHQPAYVDWNPGSDTISMVPGMAAGDSAVFPGAGGNGMPAQFQPAPGGNEGGNPMPYNPQGVVPQGQLEWFGKWRGPNKGKTMDEVYQDNFERGWHYGPDFQAPAGWGAQGSRPTTWGEVGMKNPSRVGGAPGGAQRAMPGPGGVQGGSPAFTLPGQGGSPAFTLPGGGGQGGSPNFMLPGGGQRAMPGPGGAPGGGSSGNPAWGVPRGGSQPIPYGNDMIGGQPGMPGGGPGGGGMPDYFGAGLSSARDAYLSSVPVMQRDMDDAISRAMATAGFTGNRFSTSAEKAAAEEGGRAGLRQNQLMGGLLRDATESGLNRALSATGMSLDDQYRYNQMGFQGNQNAQDRALQATGLYGNLLGQQNNQQRGNTQDLFEMGKWETGRQDQFNMLPFFDWQQNRYGMLPDIMRMVGGVGNPSMQSPTQTSSPGGAGAIDYINLINSFRRAYG